MFLSVDRNIHSVLEVNELFLILETYIVKRLWTLEMLELLVTMENWGAEMNVFIL